LCKKKRRCKLISCILELYLRLSLWFYIKICYFYNYRKKQEINLIQVSIFTILNLLSIESKIIELILTSYFLWKYNPFYFLKIFQRILYHKKYMTLKIFFFWFCSFIKFEIYLNYTFFLSKSSIWAFKIFFYKKKLFFESYPFVIMN